MTKPLARVDYAQLRHDTSTFTLKQFINGEVEVGDQVDTKDSAGNSCPGTVKSIEREIVEIELDAASFKPAEEGGYNGS